MIITRTPFRVSFAGGGSDLEAYYANYGGSVVSVSINKYIYLSMHPYFNQNKIFLKYSKNEYVDNIKEIKHNIIRQIFEDYKITGVDFNSSADVPSGAGLGSSSAFTSGLITLCNAYNRIYMSQEDIAKYACDIEIKKLGEPIGKQDQYACSIGGLNFFEFNQDNTVSVEKILLRPDDTQKLESNLLMFYLGKTRSASEVLSEQKLNMENNVKVGNLHKMVALSKELKIELQNENIDAMGDILHQGWMYKKELAVQISNEGIDHYYDIALKNGATGGKLLGAGKGGFLLFYVPQEKQYELRKSLSDLVELDFHFDNEGAKVVYHEE